MTEKKQSNSEQFNPNRKYANKPVSEENPEVERETLYEKEIDKKLVEKQLLESFSENLGTYTIEVLKPTRLKKILSKLAKLVNVNLNINTKIFKVKRVVPAQVIAWNAILIDVPEVSELDLSGDDAFLNMMKLTTKENTLSICKVLAMYLDGDSVPNKKTVELIYNNLQFNQIAEILIDVMKHSSYQDFITTMLLTKAKTSLKTSEKKVVK